MAEGKKSFVAYCDWLETFEALPDDKAGQLAKHLFRYVNDLEPESNDILITAVFANMKHTLKRDLKKYDNYIEKQRVNGTKGGRPKNPTESQKTQALKNKPKKADSVSVSVNVNDIIEKRTNEFKEEIRLFKSQYSDDMLLAFFSYWSEPTKDKKKMRKDLERTWDTKRRLITWFNRSK